ncbi:MAG: V-type ATP synthase subunit I [Firmicutes bacterium]|nr:V-type ATP synthase subunit I [Bacillota bacterium]
MAISEMSRVTVLGHESRIGEVVNVLQELGTVEVSQFGENLADEERLDLACPYDPSERVAELDGVLAELEYVIDMMSNHSRVKRDLVQNFTGYRLYMTEEEWASYVQDGLARAHDLYERAKAIDDALAQLASSETAILTSLEHLMPWQGLDLPVEEVRSGRHVGLMLGTIDARRFEAALTEVSEAADGLAWELIGVGSEKACVLVAYALSDADEAMRSLSQAGFAEVRLDQYNGVPKEILAGLRGELDNICKRRDEIGRDMDALVEERSSAFALHDHFYLERSRYDITNRFGGTEHTFMVEGWVQAKDLEEFRTQVRQIANDIVVLDRPPLEDEEAPVELTNKGLAAPFEVITKTMGYPRQGTIDPSPYLGPFFLIFFGLCMTDAAYGLFIAGIALLLMKKTRSRLGDGGFLDLIFMCGLATVFVGALLGGWLGDLPKRLFGWDTAILFDPLENPTTFLILSFVMGVVQLYAGIIIKGYDNMRKGEWLSAIYDQGFWLVWLTSLMLTIGGSALGAKGPQIAAISKWFMIGSALGLIATQGRQHKNPIKRIGSGLLSLYNTTGFMSDVISYARLFGLGFTSTVLASVMNDLFLRPAGIPVIGPVLAIVGLAFGHLFNILINIIGSYVHSSRLQYVEFFGQFFEAGGRRFMPFGMSTKYVTVDNSKEA